MLTNKSGWPIEEFSLLALVADVLTLSEKDRQLALALYAHRGLNCCQSEKFAREVFTALSPTAVRN